MGIKLNLGCGVNKIDGFVNVDKFDHGQPDVVADLEVTPWPFGSDEVDEILLNHALEHMGRDPDVFLAIMKEMYRVCRHDARIHINVPHPRHSTFINDPTHVRAITPEMMGLFSKSRCLYWQSIRAANTPLALYLNVDFEMVRTTMVLDDKYMKQLQAGTLTQEQLHEMIERYNNIVTECRIELRVIKSDERLERP